MIDNAVYRRELSRRRKVLNFLKEYKFRIFSVATCILIVGTITTIVIEFKTSCKPDIKLWLLIYSGRIVVSYIMQCFVEAVSGDYVGYRGNLSYVQKIIELLNVFGMVWFSVGNLLVFNAGTTCQRSEPLIYYFSFANIIYIYTAFIVPMLIRGSLVIYPHFDSLNGNRGIMADDKFSVARNSTRAEMTDAQVRM